MRSSRPITRVAALVAVLGGCSSNGGSRDASADLSDWLAVHRDAFDFSPKEKPEDYLDRSLRDQVAAMEAGKITSAGLTKAYLARIDTRDKGEHGTHAIIVIDSEALQHAAALDGTRGAKALLQGAAILVKDNIDTQGIATTAGSLAMANNIPASDAFVVRRLHDAHALMFGKTNLSEWANFRGNKATSGWSSLGGQTFNGANTAYNPCGSSSGSAAAVAAGLASAALGSETDGSIVCPASVNGVVGFKPTVGLVSRAGVIPISHTLDTVGPLTRTVADAARLMSALAGPDPKDQATQTIPQGMSLDFEAPLGNATLQGKRLGVVSCPVFPANVMTVFNAERTRLQNAGAVLIDLPCGTTSSWGPDEYTVMTYEFKVGINAYLAAHARTGQANTLQELIDFNKANAATVMPYFGQEVFLDAQATTGLDAPAYLTAKQNMHDKTDTNGISAALAAKSLDALISPTASQAWITNYTTGDLAVVSSSLPAAAGFPHLTVPMGTTNGLPVGMSFFGRAWDDAKILALGHAYEQVRRQ